MEREADYTDFPKLCRPGRNSNNRCIQLNVNLLPDGLWVTTIAEITKKWIDENEFKGEGTVWSLCRPSADFGGLISAEFVLCWKLSGFKEYLYENMRKISTDCVRWSYIDFSPNDGWTTVCHVQEGKVWKEIDAITWSSM